MELDGLIVEILDALKDKNEFPELKYVELAETMEKIKKRNKYRRRFKQEDIKLVFSDRQIRKEQGDESEGESCSSESDGESDESN